MVEKKDQYNDTPDFDFPKVIKINGKDTELPDELHRPWIDILKIPSVYKYRDWQYAEHNRMLTHNEIHFTSARQFNDPFDTTIPLRYDVGSKDQVIEWCKKHIKLDNPDLNEREAERKAVSLTHDPYFIKQLQVRANQEFENRKNDYFGIFSVSENNNNILMWSHYSNKHRGFCVGFDVKKLMLFFGNLFKSEESLNVIPCNVIYSQDYPILNPYTMDPSVLIMRSLTYKSMDWSYEKEFRLLLIDGTDRSFILPEGIIKKVILGCKMSKKHEEEISEILKQKNKIIELMKANRAHGRFGLEFEKIDY